MEQVSDIHIVENTPLPTPQSLCSKIARNKEQALFVADSRHQLREIIFEKDKRFLMIIGPCSIHDVNAGLEYAKRLAALAKKVSDRLYIVMRVYFEKPRTTTGWKGLIMDPHLDGSADIAQGLHLARQFLTDIIDLGIPTATELLDPITPQYIADLICWSAIGARTSESQIHRQMASGLSMPLGFKNATSGNIQGAINAIQAASQKQTFLGVNYSGMASAVTTKGNPDCHLILRGGEQGPNFERKYVAEAVKLFKKQQLKPAILIDASHDNSDKDYRNQPTVLKRIVDQFIESDENNIIGTIMESNLIAGKQSLPQQLDDLVYGQSITDSCIDWGTTENLILETYSRLT